MDKKTLKNLSPFERWQDIKGYEGLYQISNTGNVKSVERVQYKPMIGNCIKKELLLRPGLREGYPSVSLMKNGRTTNFTIHRLLAEHFIPNPDNLPCINHKNAIRSDNRLENLEWCTYSHNNSEAYRTGNQIPQKPGLGKIGGLHHQAKPILQFSRDGSFIKEFDALKSAHRETGIDFRNISACCLGKINHAGGFDWRYKEDMSAYEHWQVQKYKSLLPETNIPNDGKSEGRRFSEWMQHEAEQQMLKDEEYYSSIKD